jgi:hypothetical protein
MKKSLKLLMSSVLVAITSSVPLTVYGMEHEEKGPAGMQAQKNVLSRESRHILLAKARKREDERGQNQKQEAAEAQRIEESEKRRIRGLQVPVPRQKDNPYEIREATIDSCIQQYKEISRPELTYNMLLNSLVEIIQIYEKSIVELTSPMRIAKYCKHANSEWHFITNFELENIKARVKFYCRKEENIKGWCPRQVGQVDKNEKFDPDGELADVRLARPSARAAEAVWLAWSTQMKSVLALPAQSHYHMVEETPVEMWRKEIERDLKSSIKESMEVYNQFHGSPHPSWDEFSKMLRHR